MTKTNADTLAQKEIKPLFVAVQTGDPQKLSHFLGEKTGTDLTALLEARDAYDLTALMRAALNGRKDMVQALLAKGADPNAQNKNGLTALMLAALNGHQDTAQSLIDAGADLNVRDNGGWTALMQAALEGHEDIAGALIEKGADPDVQTIGKYFFFINMEEVEIPPGSTARNIARIAWPPEVAAPLPATAAPDEAPPSYNA